MIEETTEQTADRIADLTQARRLKPEEWAIVEQFMSVGVRNHAADDALVVGAGILMKLKAQAKPSSNGKTDG